MLAIPVLLGLALTRLRAGAGWWALPGLVLAFLAQDALVQAAHAAGRGSASYVRGRLFWGCLYLASAGLCFLTLLVLTPTEARPAVLPVALPSAAAAAIWGVHSALHRRRALWSELIGMAGMALVAALLPAATGVPPSGLPMGAAAIAFAYCLSSVSYVRAYERRRSAPTLAPTVALVVHVLLLTGVTLLARQGSVPGWALLAFLPVLLRLAAGLLAPPRDLRALGKRELWVASAFTVISVVSFWLSA